MTRFLLIAVSAALISCSQPPAPQANAPIGPAPEAQPTGALSAAGLSPQTLIGRWGDSGDCNNDVVFNTDGSFHSYTGGDGQWSLDGDIITMSGAGGVFQLRARVIDARTLELTNPDGAIFTSNRC